MMNLIKERHSDVPIEIVPGISSINGAAARLDCPLQMVMNMSRLFQQRDDYEAMKKAIENNDCIVFIKVAKVCFNDHDFKRVRSYLKKHRLLQR